GRSGMPVASWIEHADGRTEDFDTPGKIGGHPMVAGDRVVLRSAGAGGYGDPLEREPERVLDDLRLGYISADVASTPRAAPWTRLNPLGSVERSRWSDSCRKPSRRLMDTGKARPASAAFVGSARLTQVLRASVRATSSKSIPTGQPLSEPGLQSTG